MCVAFVAVAGRRCTFTVCTYYTYAYTCEYQDYVLGSQADVAIHGAAVVDPEAEHPAGYYPPSPESTAADRASRKRPPAADRPSPKRCAGDRHSNPNPNP